MRKRCRRTVRREAAPTLVAYYLNPEVSTQERMSVVALRGGYATTSHFDVWPTAATCSPLPPPKRTMSKR